MKLTLTPLKKPNDLRSLTDNEFCIHQGLSYQAAIPTLSPVVSPIDHEADLFWRPTVAINDRDLNNYIEDARREHHMNEEQALAILTICKYKISKSKALMEEYTPEHDEWTIDDKFLFEQAYQSYGKVFSRIKQMLPWKTIAELVRYYYQWKKTRKWESLMDKQAQQCQLMPDDEEYQSNDEEMSTNTDATSLSIRDSNYQNKTLIDRKSTVEKDPSSSADATKSSFHYTPTRFFCDDCIVYWKTSGFMRPEGYRSRVSMKSVQQPPTHMSLDLNGLTSLNQQCDPIEKLEIDIRDELFKLQSLNQTIESLTQQSRADLEHMEIPFLMNINQVNEIITTTWSTEEILLAVQAFAKYGKDFHTVARIIGPTKSTQDVEKFYHTHCERYQLDGNANLSAHPITYLQSKTR